VEAIGRDFEQPSAPVLFTAFSLVTASAVQNGHELIERRNLGVCRFSKIASDASARGILQPSHGVLDLA
jgi:hypothetical protein